MFILDILKFCYSLFWRITKNLLVDNARPGQILSTYLVIKYLKKRARKKKCFVRRGHHDIEIPTVRYDTEFTKAHSLLLFKMSLTPH